MPKKPIRVREDLKISRALFAAYLRTKVRTLENREQGRARPNAQAPLVMNAAAIAATEPGAPKSSGIVKRIIRCTMTRMPACLARAPLWRSVVHQRERQQPAAAGAGVGEFEMAITREIWVAAGVDRLDPFYIHSGCILDAKWYSSHISNHGKESDHDRGSTT